MRGEGEPSIRWSLCVDDSMSTGHFLLPQLRTCNLFDGSKSKRTGDGKRQLTTTFTVIPISELDSQAFVGSFHTNAR